MRKSTEIISEKKLGVILIWYRLSPKWQEEFFPSWNPLVRILIFGLKKAVVIPKSAILFCPNRIPPIAKFCGCFAVHPDRNKFYEWPFVASDLICQEYDSGVPCASFSVSWETLRSLSLPLRCAYHPRVRPTMRATDRSQLISSRCFSVSLVSKLFVYIRYPLSILRVQRPVDMATRIPEHQSG